MTYWLGKDVEVYMTTEQKWLAVSGTYNVTGMTARHMHHVVSNLRKIIAALRPELTRRGERLGNAVLPVFLKAWIFEGARGCFFVTHKFFT